MTESVLVDVVMCTNRVSPFMPQALASLRAQTYSRWRLIVADDGSGRGPEIEDLVAGVTNAVVVHLAAGGPEAARNAAIRVGEGSLVSFLDDDDEWPRDRLRLAVEALEHSPNALGAYGDGQEIDAEGLLRGVWTSPAATTEEYLDGRGALPRITTLTLRRSALERFGLLVDGLYFAEDTELTLRMARHGPLVSTGAVMVRYRRHDANATGADWRLAYRGGLRAIAINADAARSAGRHDHVRLLRRNRARYRRFAAAEGVSHAIGNIRRRQLLRATRDIGSALVFSPIGAVRAFGGRALSRRARASERSLSP